MILSGELADRAMQLPPDQRKLAAQLGIKDIKVFMSYLGYELCGEFTAKDTDEIQKVELEVEIDLNEGKACYILIHPPPGKKAFLIISSSHEAKLVGDEEQRREYLMRSSSMETEGRYFLGTLFRRRSGYRSLRVGKSGHAEDDVERPYASRIGLGKVFGQKS
jgi:hypothetical protein